MSGCDFSEAFQNKKEMEESMINRQSAIKSELLEIEKQIKLDMLKDIQKANERCKKQVATIYKETGKFPANFKCTTYISSGTYHLNSYHSVERLPILKEIQKTSVNKITFEEQKNVRGAYSEYHPMYNVTLNKII
jgi:hypothetical protein